MASLGYEFKAAREARGLSVKEMADSTRITLSYLEAIENDRLDILPGGFFIKGMLRSYAKAVGLNGEQIVEKYERAGVLGASSSEKDIRARTQPKMSAKQARYLAVIVSVLLIGLTFLVFFLVRKGNPPAAPEPNKTPSSIAIPAVPPLQKKEPEARTAPKEDAAGMNLEISFLDRTWIQVFADGALVVDGVKLRGEKTRVSASRDLVINLGNAGGLDYTLNGKPGKSFGRSGAVVKNIRITPETLTQFFRSEGMGTE